MIALIEYGAGNTASVSNSLKDLGVEFIVTNKESEICKAEKVIFPGVGEASSAIRKLHMTNLFNLLRVLKRPLLGICVGLQLLCDKSEEGNVSCLGVLPVNVKKFDETKVKVPHMGWNKVKQLSDSKLFKDIPDESYFYFAHSYYLPMNDYCIAKTTHDVDVCAAIEKDNFYGVQFHAEKSGEVGQKILRNFIELC